ncbi:MAG: MFS transporter [Bradyrhizobium sp.]
MALSISTLGPPWPLWLGHGLFIGLIGLAGINAPLYIYVSRWFDRRRGSALALISSGTYLAGALWPPVFEQAIARFGWRQTMLWYALAEIILIVPLSVIYFRAPPEVIHPVAPAAAGSAPVRVLGWPPNAVFAAMCAAAVLCCVPMAMPQGHLIAFLHRSRDQPVDERADAVGAARNGVSEPAGLGRDIGSYRRSCDHIDWIGLAGGVDDGVSVDAERSRIADGVRRFRARLFRHHPGLCAGGA